MDDRQQTLLRTLPQVQKLIDSKLAASLMETYSRQGVLQGIRASLDALRRDFANGNARPFENDAFFRDLRGRLERQRAMSLQRVINATGIGIHTNLGRAPLPLQALDAIRDVSIGYSNLEFDLETGTRGSRYAHVDKLLQSLSGAEAAIVVNNNAAAVILVLNTLAEGQEVIVSRGEQVEIGGSFRIPDVIGSSGARLVEVGSTNKTRVEDYAQAITENTGILLKVHTSNYRIVGFTASASREDLSALARNRNLPLVEDLGSGTLIDLAGYGLPHEITVQEVVQAGIDVVTFSGDKLLGGPQAGIVVGKKTLIEKLRKNPLIRALRIDKLSLAALEATLRLYLDEDRLHESLPLLHQLTQSGETLSKKAAELQESVQSIQGVTVAIEDGEGYAGGGSLPEEAIKTKLVTIRASRMKPNALAEALRKNTPPIVGRIADDALLLDVRTIADSEIGEVTEALSRILS